MTSSPIHQALIIGSGPAGYTCAIYAARAGLEPLLIEGSQPGGQLTITTEVENFPGFPEGVMGPDLMDLMRRQAERFGTIVKQDTVVSVDPHARPFSVQLENGETVLTRAIVIATGASARWLGLESERSLMGRGVSACATCDGFFFRGKHVVVIGGGDTALEEATFLTRFATKVSIIHRRDELRASKPLQERAKNNPKIEFIWNAVIDEVLGEEKVTGVKLRNVTNSEQFEMACEGVFVAIGHEPNTQCVRGLIALDEKGFVIRNKDSNRTSTEGVFVCGDVCDPIYRQAITAAGEGCRAALDLERWLAETVHS